MFTSSRLKIERADQHIAELEAILNEFLNENPYSIFIQADRQLGTLHAGVELGAPLPAHVSTITGDAIHNLRTALDHLACALVEAGGGTVNNYTGFPFHEDRENFQTNFDRKIKGASKCVLDLIEAEQPYKGGLGDELWRLNKLDIADKHRRLILAVRVIALPKITVRKPDGSVAGVFESCETAGDGTIKLVGVTGDAKFEFENKDQAPISVAFKDSEVFEGDDVLSTLRKMSLRVLETVNVFERALTNE